ncbi:MAG: DUF58 domain-containing protein [Bryobacterales bacterium]|jgi:uncharacterized protein (DUF58 family)|nr:DUF58 domain-containing protein [Bryobacterales bacterium]
MKILRQLFVSFRRFRLTLAGFVFAFTMVLVGTLAFLSAANLLLLIFASMLATWLISGFVSRLCLAGLEVDFQLPNEISARQPVGGRVLLKNLKRLTPSFSVHLRGTRTDIQVRPLYVPVVGGGQVVNESTQLTFGRRGLHKGNSLSLSTSFPFGFLERRVTVNLERQVIVFPCMEGTQDWRTVHAVIAREITAMQQGRGHDFYRLRDYVLGESAKSVDWKATAHTRRLMVREFAREESLEVEIFLDLHDAGRGAVWFEKAVECAAYLVWQITLAEVRLRFHSQEFSMSVPRQGTVYDVLRYLALVSPLPRAARMPREPECDLAIVISADQSQFETLEWQGALRIDANAVDPGPATEDSVR